MVYTLDTMVLYSSNVVWTSGRMVYTVDSMVLYIPNLVLTSGQMVCTGESMVLYSSNLVLTSGHPRQSGCCKIAAALWRHFKDAGRSCRMLSHPLTGVLKKKAILYRLHTDNWMHTRH